MEPRIEWVGILNVNSTSRNSGWEAGQRAVHVPDAGTVQDRDGEAKRPAKLHAESK